MAKGYSLMSGTSFSSPYIAGIAALYLEKFGRSAASQFPFALMNSATPIAEKGYTSSDPEDVGALSGEGSLSSVIRQGSGGVNLQRVLNTVNYLEPRKLELGSLKSQGSLLTKTVTIHNKGATAKSYVFKHEPALAVSVTDTKKPKQSHKLDIRVTINPRTVSVPPNGKVKISIDFNTNSVKDHKIFYSGYIEAHESKFAKTLDADTILRVPYMGYAGDLNGVNVFDAQMFHSTTIGGLLPVKDSNSGNADTTSALSSSDSLVVMVNLLLPSPDVTAVLVEDKDPSKVIRVLHEYGKQARHELKVPIPRVMEMNPGQTYRVKVIAKQPSTHANADPDTWISPSFLVR
jgi:hypothetical protein